MSGGAHHRWRTKASRLAIQGLTGDALDVATGTGDFAISLSKQSGVQQVVGLDFVPEMLYLAQEKLRRRHIQADIVFLQGDAVRLPFHDDSFACATCGFGLRNVVDVPGALAEMARVIRPSGRVVILEIVTSDKMNPLTKLARFYFHRAVPLLGRFLAGDWDAYKYLPRSVDVFPSTGELVRIMEGVGLQNVQHRTMGLGLVSIHVGEKA